MHPAVLFALVAVPAFWCTLVFVIGALGGWRRLAASFPARDPPSGRRFSLESATFGPFSHYGHCLTVYRSDEGITLSVLWPFRLGHPPIFIPWDEIHVLTTKRRFLEGERVMFEVGSPPVARIELSKRVFEASEP